MNINFATFHCRVYDLFVCLPLCGYPSHTILGAEIYIVSARPIFLIHSVCYQDSLKKFCFDVTYISIPGFNADRPKFFNNLDLCDFHKQIIQYMYLINSTFFSSRIFH